VIFADKLMQAGSRSNARRDLDLRRRHAGAGKSTPHLFGRNEVKEIL